MGRETAKDLQFFEATVVESIPDAGLAVVVYQAGGAEGLKSVVAYLPYTDVRYGVNPITAYTPGTMVLCVWRSVASALVAQIIFSYNFAEDPYELNYREAKLYNAEDISQSEEAIQADHLWMAKNFSDNLDKVARPHANGAQGDLMPGDYDALDKYGHNGIHVGRLVSTLKGSATAFVDASVLESRLRLVGETVSIHGFTHESETGTGYSVSNTAISLNEAFGIRTGPAVKLRDETVKVFGVDGKETDVKIQESLQLAEEDAVPLYRIQHTEGSPVFGREDIIVEFPHGAQKHTYETPPSVLARSRQSLSGERSEASTYSLLSIKTPYIPAVQQLYYKKPVVQQQQQQQGNGTAQQQRPAGKPLFDDLRTPYALDRANEVETAVTPSEEDKYTDAALNKLLDKLLASDYKDKIMRIMAKKGFSLSKEEDQSLAKRATGGKEPWGATKEQQYPLPNKIELTDPITNKKRVYYDSTSFISQEADGSICICDGYGSEIRMSRGNIYISPALDLFMRPGRDLSVMAGRHQSYDSQDTCTINSSTDAYIRSGNLMRVSGGYMMTLEGTQGIVQSSRSDIKINTPRSIYIARVKDEDGGEDAAATGSIVIDAAEDGSCSVSGDSCTVQGRHVVQCAYDSGSVPEGGGGGTPAASVTQLHSSGMVLYAPAFTCTASTQIVSLQTPATTGVLVRGKEETISVAKSDRPQLRVQDTVSIGEDLIIEGSALVKSHGAVNGNAIIANGVCNTSDTCTKVSRFVHVPGKDENDPGYTKDIFETSPVKPLENEVTLDTGAKLRELFHGNSQLEKALRVFAFPTSYNTAISVVPGMVWQEKATGRMWDPAIVKDSEGQDTACYPGIDVWTKAHISKAGYRYHDMLMDSYRTNCEG